MLHLSTKSHYIAYQEASGWLDVWVLCTTPNMFSPRHGGTATKYISSRVSIVENTKSGSTKGSKFANENDSRQW